MENSGVFMRILNISSLYPPNVVGGAELVVRTMSQAMSALGHEMSVATLAHKNALHTDVDVLDGDIKVYPIPLANIYWPFNSKLKQPSGSSRLLWHGIDTNNVMMSYRVNKILDKVRPDLVLTNNLQGFSTSIFPLLKSKNIPVVHVLHDFSLICPRTTLFKDGKMCGHNDERCKGCKLLSAPRIKHAMHINGVIGVSKAVLKIHQEHGLFNNANTRVIYNSLQETIKPIKKIKQKDPSQVFNFGYIGRIEKSKGIETLLKACKKLQENNHKFKLLVAGRGEDGYLDYLKKIWPLENVEYLGFTKQIEFYSQIDALVFPSEWLEGLGNVAFEAFSQAVPVIGSNIGGIPETVTHNETGYIYTPGNYDQLSKYMLEMLSNPVDLRRMAENALHKSFDYLPKNRAEEYQEFLADILNNCSRGIAYA